MAKMVPEALAPDVPASERYIYNRLQAALPSSWTVLHGRRFFLPSDRSSRAHEGELDFLVVDPRRGALGLEVKGGGIERTSAGWTSVDRSGTRHRIRDPGTQASSASHAIHRYLRGARAFGRAGYRLAIGWGVVLPDVDVRGDLGPDLPRRLIIDRGDLASPEPALGRLFEAHGIEGPPLGPPALRSLLDVLLPTCRLVPSLAARFQQEGQQLIRLTEEQAVLLDFLEQTPRAAIQGAAGTGKTLLALEKARRLSASGWRTLLLCFNRPLAEELGKSAEGFDVYTFHGICHLRAQSARIPFRIPTSLREQSSFWAEEAPLLLLEALEKAPRERYDAVVIDEGQDFRENWWPAIEEMLRDHHQGILYVFFDPYQNLYGGRPPVALGVAPHQLVYNCRNTSRIASYAAALVGAEGRVRPGSPMGADVEEVECDTDAEMVNAARRVLHRLIVEEKIEHSSIRVLSTRNPAKSVFKQHRRLGNFRLVPPDAKPQPMSVVFTSLHRFKGLESDVVILTDVREGEHTSRPEHLYVGSSRARHLLVVLRHRHS